MKWDELRRMKFSEEEIRQIDREAIEELVEIDLRALRESAGKTQTELAELSKLAQSELSKIERRTTTWSRRSGASSRASAAGSR